MGGAQRLKCLQGLAAGGIGRDDLIDEAGVGSAGTLGGAGGFGVFTQGTHINHGTILCQVARLCPPPCRMPNPQQRPGLCTNHPINSTEIPKVIHLL